MGGGLRLCDGVMQHVEVRFELLNPIPPSHLFYNNKL